MRIIAQELIGMIERERRPVCDFFELQVPPY
jgi:hypothetical protein